MEYNTVCGLEVHTELSTKTKIFCNCSTAFGGEPNSHVCSAHRSGYQLHHHPVQ